MDPLAFNFTNSFGAFYGTSTESVPNRCLDRSKRNHVPKLFCDDSDTTSNPAYAFYISVKQFYIGNYTSFELEINAQYSAQCFTRYIDYLLPNLQPHIYFVECSNFTNCFSTSLNRFR